MRGALAGVKQASQSLLAESDGSEQHRADRASGTKSSSHGANLPMELLCGTFWPVLMFVYIFRLNLGWWRHVFGKETFVVTMAFPILLNLWFSITMYKNLKRGTCRRWKIVMNVVLWFTIFYGCLQADKAYWRFAKSYYDFQDMASYINIDPSSDRGQTYMDAGQVYFKEGTQVEVSKAIAFQEDEIYCVAPIVQQTLDSGGSSDGNSLSGNALKLPKSGTVDFWAVGINCCDPSGLNFKCGESQNGMARAGIRVLRDDARPFFLMAVQEWTAWLQLPSKHPLFFHWVQDPLVQVDNMWFNAMKMFYTSTANCFMGIVVGNLLFQYIFFNLGV